MATGRPSAVLISRSHRVDADTIALNECRLLANHHSRCCYIAKGAHLDRVRSHYRRRHLGRHRKWRRSVALLTQLLLGLLLLDLLEAHIIAYPHLFLLKSLLLLDCILATMTKKTKWWLLGWQDLKKIEFCTLIIMLTMTNQNTIARLYISID